jgi:hypothetical protein
MQLTTVVLQFRHDSQKVPSKTGTQKNVHQNKESTRYSKKVGITSRESQFNDGASFNKNKHTNGDGSNQNYT